MPALKGTLYSIACLVLVPAAAFAQASIAGVAKDASGAVLPGVTVEAASPALIEKVRSVITDGTGQYKIVDLRPGTYSVTFTLTGFTTFKREGIELQGDFTATVDADLRVGAVAETVTVSGASPIVDVQSAVQQRVLESDVLEAIPAGRGLTNYGNLVPGVTGALDYGGTNNLNLTTLAVHGSFTGDQRMMIDGMSISATSGNGELSNFMPDITSAQEIAVSTGGGSADQPFGGVVTNLIPKEGGNRFSGSFFGTYVTRSMEGSNYTPELQTAGLRAPNTIKEVYDYNPGIGGPLLKDKLWFYSAARFQLTENYQAGIFINQNAGNLNAWSYVPDLSQQVFLPTVQKSGNGRMTWQVTPRQKISGFYEHQYRVWEVDSPTIAYESATKYDFPTNEFVTGSYSAPITSKLLFDARFSDIIQGWQDRLPTDGTSLEFTQPLPSVFSNLVAVTEQGGSIPGLIYRGAGQTGLVPFIKAWGHIASAQASLSYVTGAHAFKVGFLDTFGVRKVNSTNIAGSDRYQFNNGVPNQITETADPFGFVNNLGAELGVYAQDKWTLHRLTANLGVRYEYENINFPQQQLGPGVLVPNRNITLPAVDYLSWNDISPRLGAVYDVFGNGKTALKANLSRYVLAERLTSDYTNLGNPVNALATTVTRSWTDPGTPATNPNYYIPQCDLTNPAANGNCGPMSSSQFGQAIPSTVSDPAMLHGWNKRPYDWEFEVGVQQQLAQRVGLSVSYFRRWYGNFTVIDNLATAPSDYTEFSVPAPANPLLPNGGGYTVGGLYNLNQDKVGQVSNLFTLASNYGNMTESWNGVDVALNARLGAGATVQGGFSTGRSAENFCDLRAKLPELTISGTGVAGGGASLFSVSPTQPFCDIVGSFTTQVKFLGTYQVPKVGVQVAATYRSLPGANYTASYVASNAVIQPSLGRLLSGGAANATVNLIEPGTLFTPQTNLVDLRFSKILRFYAKYRVSLNLDVYNVGNSSGITSVSSNLANLLTPTGIHLARFYKFSANFDF